MIRRNRQLKVTAKYHLVNHNCKCELRERVIIIIMHMNIRIGRKISFSSNKKIVIKSRKNTMFANVIDNTITKPVHKKMKAQNMARSQNDKLFFSRIINRSIENAWIGLSIL